MDGGRVANVAIENKKERVMFSSNNVIFRTIKCQNTKNGRDQGSHSTWKTWKNESPPGKPENIMEFCKI